MLASLRAELLVLQKWPAAWVLVLITPLYVLLFSYAIQYVLYLSAENGSLTDLGSPEQLLPALLPNQSVIIVVNGFGFSGTAPFVVLGALAAGGDWGRGTIKTSLTQGPGRLRTFFGQALAVGLALILSVALTFAVAGAASFLVLALEADAASPADAVPPAVEVVARGLGGALLISAVYGAAGLALGTLFRGAGAAIGAALVWTVVVQNLLDTLALQVRGVFETINDALPNANALSLIGVFGAIRNELYAQMPLRTDPTVATWVLVGYVLAFVALGAIFIRRRDVS